MPSSFTIQSNKITQYTEEELVALYLETGQNNYFGLLYMRCSNSVYRHCYFLVKDPDIAQDMTHDIFLKLVTGLVSYKGKARFSTWLSRVTHNYCMDQFGLRKRKAEIPLDGRIEIADELDLVNSLLDDPTELVNLDSALTNLPAKEKEILLMRYTDNASIPEIALMFEMTVSAVKMRLSRSRKKLRTSYPKFYYR